MTTGIYRTYRGRPGCGCGCRGTYSEAKGTTTRRLREMREAIAAGEAIEVTELGEGEGAVCVTHETDARYLWLYFANQAAAEATLGTEVVRAAIEAERATLAAIKARIEERKVQQ